MEKKDIIITKRHESGPNYKTKYPPHYIIHVEHFADDYYVLTWAYNANGAVVTDKIKMEDLEPYCQG
jgi:hypothetical protein